MNRVKLQGSIIWLIALIILSVFNLPRTIYVHNIYTILGLASYLFCLRNWLSSGNSIISLYAVFVVYMMMSHIGQSLLFMINMPDMLLDVYSWCNMDSIIDYLRYHMLCSAALNTGTVMYLSRMKTEVSYVERVEACRSYSPTTNQYRIWDVVLIASLLYMIFLAVKFISLRQSMDYADYFEQRSASAFITSLPKCFSIVIGLWYVYINKYRKFIVSVWVFCTFAYMIGGSRGTAISYVGALVLTMPLIYPQLFTRRRMLYWIIGGLFAFSLMSVISASRTSNLGVGGGSSSQGFLLNLAGSISEMGGSAKTAVFSMDAITKGFIPYWQTNLYFFLAIIFPASWVQSIGLPDVELAAWVTEYAGSTWSGLGYSCVAESFVNYGWYGWAWFILYGIFIAFAENYIHKKWALGSYFVPCLLAFYLTTQIFYARAEIYHSQSAARFCVYAYILYRITKGQSKTT